MAHSHHATFAADSKVPARGPARKRWPRHFPPLSGSSCGLPRSGVATAQPPASILQKRRPDCMAALQGVQGVAMFRNPAMGWSEVAIAGHRGTDSDFRRCLGARPSLKSVETCRECLLIGMCCTFCCSQALLAVPSSHGRRKASDGSGRRLNGLRDGEPPPFPPKRDSRHVEHSGDRWVWRVTPPVAC